MFCSDVYKTQTGVKFSKVTTVIQCGLISKAFLYEHLITLHPLKTWIWPLDKLKDHRKYCFETFQLLKIVKIILS